MCEPETRPFSPLYSAFLLRCWRRDGHWHFAVENIATREKWQASSLDILVADILSELTDHCETQDRR